MAYPTAAELLPGWLRIVWVVLLVAAGGTLAWQASRTLASARWWHAAYAVMALGMLVMYAVNPMDTPGFNPPALVVFVAALVGAVALVAATVVQRRRGMTSTVSWVFAALDMITLAYIQIPADVRPVIVCVLFACYLAVVAVLRLVVAARALRGAPQRGTLALVDPAAGEVGVVAPGAAGTTGAADRGAGDGTVAAPARADVVARHATAAVALAVLGLSMFYMLSV